MINETDYVDLLVQIVQNEVDAGHPYLSAAALGEQLRRAVSDQTWKDLGYPTLSQLLRSANVEARIEMTKTDKGALAVRPKANAAPFEPLPRKEYNRLKKPVWGGFTQSAPPGRRFLNRITGAVRSGLATPPVPYDEWAEIEPIPADDQKAWAAQFLKDVGLPTFGPIRDSLSLTSWNHAFSLAIGSHGGEWNRVRSYRVAAIVDAWASAKGIPHDLVFQTQSTSTSGVSQNPSHSSAFVDSDKAVILAALSTLTLDQLRAISLPAGVLLDAARKA